MAKHKLVSAARIIEGAVGADVAFHGEHADQKKDVARRRKRVKSGSACKKLREEQVVKCRRLSVCRRRILD